MEIKKTYDKECNVRYEATYEQLYEKDIYEARLALYNIRKCDIVELKSMPKPNAIVERIGNLICLLNGIEESWNNCKNLLNTTQICARLKDLDLNSINATTIKKVNRDLSDPYFTFDSVREASCACADLYVWIWNIAKVRSMMLGIPPATRELISVIEWPSEVKTRPVTAKKRKLVSP